MVPSDDPNGSRTLQINRGCVCERLGCSCSEGDVPKADLSYDFDAANKNVLTHMVRLRCM